MPRPPATWRLCVITDARLSRGRPAAEVARAAIAGGADAIQWREMDARVRRDEGGDVLRVCRDAGVPLIVNDDCELALALGAEGLHVGQADLPAAEARRRLGPGPILGVSARTPAEVAEARRAGADYIGAGPVYEARGTKPDAAAPIGLDGLAAVCRAAGNLPVVAIGGITAANAGDAIRAGARGVAVISAVVAAPDIAAAARALRSATESRQT